MPDERTFLAFDRTLLAWIRTSTSLLTFGFAIFKLLEERAKVPGQHPVMDLVSPRFIGVVMVISGFLGLLLASINYIRFMKNNGRSGLQAYATPALMQSYVILMLCMLIIAGAFIGA